MNSELFKSFSGKNASSESWFRVAFFCIGIIVLTCIFKFQAIDYEKDEKRFYEEGFSTLVMRKSHFYGRLNEYHLANELEVFFIISDTTSITVGDSVVKEANTYYYSVYRKSTNGGYKFLAKYNFDESPYK